MREINVQELNATSGAGALDVLGDITGIAIGAPVFVVGKVAQGAGWLCGVIGDFAGSITANSWDDLTK